MAATSFAALSQELSSVLHLSVPPIGIAFRDQAATPDAAPIGGERPAPTEDGRTGAVPASCVFWTKAVDQVFSTVAEDHGNCSVGSYTHGFKSLGEVADKNDVAALVGSGWVGMEDFPHVPAVKDRPASIVYGPLERMPVEPDIVYLRLNAKQAMVLDDALGGVRFEGKPQCHIMAIAKDGGEIAISVGCMLSRVRTGMSNNDLSCAIPAARLGEVVAALRANAETERQVAAYAAADAARFGRILPN
ncbi:DUF169 domain-containing protein [Chelativorans salis]|uniref:DUF169 domain-containing protein n=1 Tax=Chelativorans salis TaxID=2978478 RepID=A0ABT2LI26_9HYPH|nr:DUF169 domain-containing protein [Chelativorans sp. EGI FJ00035]MCT7374227.1 DUF169 domain-containing protein [Chelativorans sp. EGI FJ00035]